MGKYLFAVILTACSMIRVDLVAESPSPPRKIHVDISSLKISKHGMLLTTKEKIFKVKCVRSDRAGLYVFRTDCELIGKRWEENGWVDGTTYCERCEVFFRDQNALNYHNEFHQDNDHDNFDRP